MVKFKVNIPNATTKPLTIEANSICIKGQWLNPEVVNKTINDWSYGHREEFAQDLAGQNGRLIRDVFVSSEANLIRDVWLSADESCFAIQQTFINMSSAEICLNSLFPFGCETSDGLIYGKGGIDNWQILAHKRLNFCSPESIQIDKKLNEEIEIDPVMLLGLKCQDESPLILMGFLSQQDHCARMLLRFKGGGQESIELDYFKAESEFDGVVVPPGGKKSSQWFFIKTGNDSEELFKDYANRVAAYHNIKEPPGNAPSVWLSWYYYKDYFTEDYLNEDLKPFFEEKTPFDIFLIDDCWSLNWGDWFVNNKFPSGMKAVADKIKAAGYIPAIWLAPALAKEFSSVATEHTEWLVKKKDGTLLEFEMAGDGINYVLDPTYPGVCEHISETFRRVVKDWGFEFVKCDFMRALTLDKDACFYDKSYTRLQAYQKLLQAIRKGIGDETYFLVCGGHFGGSLGIADAIRTSQDTHGYWVDEMPFVQFPQNLLRTWMSRFYHIDPDAMIVRLNEPDPELGEIGLWTNLSTGRYTDREAETIALNQYLVGNMVCFSEKFQDISPERKALYRHVIPSIQTPSVPLDIFTYPCPSKYITKVKPICNSLPNWVTYAAINWMNKTQKMSLELDQKVTENLNIDRFLVFDFFKQKVLGIYERGDSVDLGKLAPHQSVLLKITAWNGQNAVLAGTDLHFSGGAVEILYWQEKEGLVEGEIKTGWNYPVRITVAFPSKDGFDSQTLTLKHRERHFLIKK